MYKVIDENDIQYFKHIIEEKRIFVGKDISEDYSHDELGDIHVMPDVLIKVRTTEEIANIMKYAYKQNIPVTVRGSGTGLVGAAVSLHKGIMLDTTLMNHILELDDNNLTVTVECGVLLMDLAAFATEHGFMYPPDPGEKSATIGGNISTNAGGMRAVKYGVTRDYVRGLTCVTSNGEIIHLGGKTVKNSTGYNLLGLVAGSEGTLCIITEAILKLIPLPEYNTSLLVPFPTVETAIGTVPELIKSKISLTAIEFMEKATILFSEEYLGKKFPDTKANAYLLLTIDGNSQEVINLETTKAAELCLEHGALDALFVDTDERKESVWNARSAFLEAIKASTDEMDECDVVVPRDLIAQFIHFTHDVAEQSQLRIESFGHAGDGNLHIYLCRDQLEDSLWQERKVIAFDLLYNKANQMAGLVSGEHGIGYAKKEYMKRYLSEEEYRIMQQVKLAFDPTGILNPGKVIN